MLEAVDKIKYSYKKTSYIGVNKDLFLNRMIDKDYPKKQSQSLQIQKPKKFKGYENMVRHKISEIDYDLGYIYVN